MFWLSTVSVGDPAAKRQLPFGPAVLVDMTERQNYSVAFYDISLILRSIAALFRQ